MVINKVMEGRTLTLVIEGEIDTPQAAKFQEVLIQSFEEADEVILDFDKVDYIASATIRALMVAENTSKAKGVPMSLINVTNEKVTKVFYTVGAYKAKLFNFK